MSSCKLCRTNWICFQPGRILCRSFLLHNLAYTPVAFKLKTNAAQSYIVKPGHGVILPRDHVHVSVYMQPQPFMPASHRFLLQVSSPQSGCPAYTLYVSFLWCNCWSFMSVVSFKCKAFMSLTSNYCSTTSFPSHIMLAHT